MAGILGVDAEEGKEGRSDREEDAIAGAIGAGQEKPAFAVNHAPHHDDA